MYESFYKLKAKPFQLSPDPRFFFNSRGHKRAMSYLRYGIRQGEGFIIITGDVGTGKTTLVTALFNKGRVRHDDIDSRHGIITKGDAQVDHHPSFPVPGTETIQVQIHADFTCTPKGGKKQFVSGRHINPGCSTDEWRKVPEGSVPDQILR